MKILFLADAFRLGNVDERIGGGEISNILLLQELSISHDVYVLAAYGCNGWNIKRNGLICFDLSACRALAWLPTNLRNIAARLVFRLVAPHVSKAVGPDVVLCGPYQVNVAVKISEKGNLLSGVFIRAFENFRKDASTHWRDRFRDFVRRLVYGDFDESVLRRMGLLIPNSNFMKEKCDAIIGGVKSHVCYPPMDSEANVREYPESIKTVLMVSTEQKKGYDLFRKLAERLPGVNFLAVGDVGVNGKKRISENLQVTGWVDDLENILSSVDLVLVPSLWEEPFGRIAVEALRCGCVVFVSSKGGLPETVDYQASLVVDSDDEMAWMQRIVSFEENRRPFVAALSSAVANSEKYRLKSQAEHLELVLLREIGNR